MSAATLGVLARVRRELRRTGWKVAETLTPIAYIAWSAWLIATGIALLV